VFGPNGGSGATTRRPLWRNVVVEKLRGDPTVRAHPKAWPEIKDGRSSAKEAQMRDNPEGHELILQLMSAGAAKTNSHSV